MCLLALSYTTSQPVPADDDLMTMSIHERNALRYRALYESYAASRDYSVAPMPPHNHSAPHAGPPNTTELVG
jgi:hypothetical protein